MQHTHGRFASVELCEYHEFLPDEIDDGRLRRRTLPRPTEPWDRARAIEAFRAHLPALGRADALYPWDDRAWQGAWASHDGGLHQEEAWFWFAAMTDPRRWTTPHEVVEALESLDVTQPADGATARARLVSWFNACQTHRARVPWFMYAYLARLMVAWLPASEVFSLWTSLSPEPIPRAELCHFFDGLAVHDSGDGADGEADRVALEAGARTFLESLDFEDEGDLYAAIRLLQRVPMYGQALRLARILMGQEDGTVLPHVARDVVDLLSDEDFVEGFCALPYPVEPSRVAWIVDRGGFEVAGALVQRVAEGPDELQRAAFKDLVRLHAPQVVPGFLSLWAGRAVSRPAYGWLMAEGANAIEGCAQILIQKDAPLHARALEIVRGYVLRGHRELVESVLALWPQPQRQELEAMTLWDG